MILSSAELLLWAASFTIARTVKNINTAITRAVIGTDPNVKMIKLISG